MAPGTRLVAGDRFQRNPGVHHGGVADAGVHGFCKSAPGKPQAADGRIQSQSADGAGKLWDGVGSVDLFQKTEDLFEALRNSKLETRNSNELHGTGGETPIARI